MLRPLAQLLDGAIAPPPPDALIPWLRGLDPELFGEVHAVTAVTSPGGDRLAVCAAVTERGWFTARRRFAGFVVVTQPTGKIVGDLVVGFRQRSAWELLRTIESNGAGL